MTEEIPSTSAHGVSAEERDFLYHVGLVMSEWAAVDEQLFRVFAKTLNAGMRKSAILYYRNNTISARLQLLEDLLVTVLPAKDDQPDGKIPEVTKIWRVISKDIADQIKVRNHLAHSKAGPMVELGDKPDGSIAITDIWWASYKSESEKLGRKNADQQIGIKEVKAHIKIVSQLWMRIRNFGDIVESLT